MRTWARGSWAGERKGGLNTQFQHLTIGLSAEFFWRSKGKCAVVENSLTFLETPAQGEQVDSMGDVTVFLQESIAS